MVFADFILIRKIQKLKRKNEIYFSGIIFIVLAILTACNGIFPLAQVHEVMTVPLKAVSAGRWHTAIITDDGNLWAWGFNGYGQLGDGTTEDRQSAAWVMDGVKRFLKKLLIPIRVQQFFVGIMQRKRLL